MMAPPLHLRQLLAVGPKAVARYTGTLLAVHLVQLLVVVACLLAIALVLAQTFGHLPMFDDAIDGDLVAMIECIQFGSTSFLAISGIVFGAIVVWQLVTWFLVGGLLGVLVQRPEGRRAVGRTFGASGTATYLAYARLAVLQLPALMIVLIVFSTGLGAVHQRLVYALTIPELLGALALGTLPGILLLHYVWTVTDYARVELTLRHDSHDPSVLMTYARALAYVLKHPVTLLHGAIGWIVFVLVTLAYAYVANGHPMFGPEGAVTLFVARQGVSLLRTAIRVGILGGQLELGRTRPAPTRRGDHAIDVAA
ncbi:MAG: hypothetical protein NT062_10595 [Proteobacteria bacterium]|nr:hypothetical protein [Pseudomonadota bacterium]